jgi:hypothetical protein
MPRPVSDEGAMELAKKQDVVRILPERHGSAEDERE